VRIASGLSLHRFLLGADRPGSLWGSLCDNGLSRQTGCPGTTCRSIRVGWLAVMFMEHDREWPSARCCRGQQIRQAFNCSGGGGAEDGAFGTPGATCGSIPYGVPRRRGTGLEGGRRVGSLGLESGDMATRRTLRRRRLWRAQQDGRLAGTEGIAIRTAWLTWRHLAASRGRNAKCAFRVSRKAHLEFRRGAFGWVVGMEDRREVRATHGFRAFRRRPKGYGGHSEVACGHTILSRASGPDLLLLERAGGLGVTRGCPSLRGQARGMT